MSNDFIIEEVDLDRNDKRSLMRERSLPVHHVLRLCSEHQKLVLHFDHGVRASIPENFKTAGEMKIPAGSMQSKKFNNMPVLLTCNYSAFLIISRTVSDFRLKVKITMLSSIFSIITGPHKPENVWC